MPAQGKCIRLVAAYLQSDPDTRFILRISILHLPSASLQNALRPLPARLVLLLLCATGMKLSAAPAPDALRLILASVCRPTQAFQPTVSALAKFCCATMRRGILALTW